MSKESQQRPDESELHNRLQTRLETKLDSLELNMDQIIETLRNAEDTGFFKIKIKLQSPPKALKKTKTREEHELTEE